jgi:hypothetical protein
MKSCARLLIGLSAALLLMAPLTRGQQQRTLLHGRLPGLGEVNVTVAEKQSGETELVHAVTHKGLLIFFNCFFFTLIFNAEGNEADNDTPPFGFITGNLATRRRVASLRAKIDFDESEQIYHPDMDLTTVRLITFAD